MSNKKKEYLVKDNKVNMEKEGLLKDKYQEVIDFYINSTPYQHLFFLDLKNFLVRVNIFFLLF